MFQLKCFFMCFFLVGFFQQDSEILWTEETLLTWDDFKGKPDANSEAVAITAAGISYNYSISRNNKTITGFKAHVMTHFYPEYSWYKKEQVNNHILKHEQLHFDITELHARLLRKSLSQLKPSQDLEEKIKTLYNKANLSLGKMQREYDAETNYSRNGDVQNAWINKVKIHINLLVNHQF